MDGARAFIDLESLECIDEADGIGSAEPYLWTVFFKIDGETAFVDSLFSLTGTSTVVGTSGNHGNLPNHDVDPGEVIPIPSELGDFETVLRPIPLQSPIGSTDAVSAVVGCIAVLMEEDGTNNSSVAKGHAALDAAVKQALDELIPTLNLGHDEPTEEELTAMEEKIADAVSSAIEDDVGLWDWISVAGDMDDKVGSAVFHFSQRALVEAGADGIPLSKRWDDEGEWQLTGRIAATPITWHEWEAFDGAIASAPAAASWEENRIDCFARGTDASLMHKWWDGSGWSGWESLGGAFKNAPGAVSWGPNRIDVFVRGMEDNLWHMWWNGSVWSSWENLGGQIASSPAVASWDANRLDVFAASPQGSILHKWWNGSVWSDWEDLGGTFQDSPAAVSWGPDRIDVLVRGLDDRLWHKWWNGAVWSDWENLGGVVTSSPAVASWEPNRLDVFARGADGVLQRGSWNGVAWTPGVQMRGRFKDGPAAVSWGPNRIDLFVRGTLRVVSLPAAEASLKEPLDKPLPFDDRMAHVWLS